MNKYNRLLDDLPKGVTYLKQLERICKKRFGKKFHGVYPSDQIPRLKPNQCCILNLDRTGEPGSHWIALYRSARGTQSFVYDSFGRRGVTLIPKLKWTSPGRVIDSDRDPEQLWSENNCGARCIAWLSVVYDQGIHMALTI